MPTKPIPTKAAECPTCYGCGHVCTRCKFGISGCYCDDDYGLDTEEIAECPDCVGTGSRLVRETPFTGQPMARA